MRAGGAPKNGAQGACHMGMIYEVDLVVDVLIKVLEDRDLTKDTIIFFTGENCGLGWSKHKSGKSRDFSYLSSRLLRVRKGALCEGTH